MDTPENRMETVKNGKEYTATKNACKLCTPLGASLVFKGIEKSVPLLHGSQGCSTYIRRYMISHFKEPIDIACSNFAEETAVFGGAVNLKLALENVNRQYSPSIIGVATTCLSETIGDDVPMFVHEYMEHEEEGGLPKEMKAPVVHVSTPSYQGTHMQGFHSAVRAVVETLAVEKTDKNGSVNIFPGMGSPADLRHLKEICADFGLPFMMLPDYSATLDGTLWTEYQKIPEGGTPVADIRSASGAEASIELGRILAETKNTAGGWLEKEHDVTCFRSGLPIGINESDRFFDALEKISGIKTPEKYLEERGRLIDSYVDSHKHVMSAKVAVYGEEDLVTGMVSFLSETGMVPVVCATGDRSGLLRKEIEKLIPDYEEKGIRIMENADFIDIETAVEELSPELIIGNSKGYTLSRRLGIPLVRIGFPIHDRIGGARLLHYGYRGTQSLFDRITNAVIEKRQAGSEIGYTYM